MQWGEAIQSDVAATIAHEVLHDDLVNHHHEDDGSIHFDASDESVQHVQDHSCSPQPGGLFVPQIVGAPNQLVELITISLVASVPDPELELPHRPPAPTLG